MNSCERLATEGSRFNEIKLKTLHQSRHTDDREIKGVRGSFRIQANRNERRIHRDTTDISNTAEKDLWITMTFMLISEGLDGEQRVTNTSWGQNTKWQTARTSSVVKIAAVKRYDFPAAPSSVQRNVKVMTVTIWLHSQTQVTVKQINKFHQAYASDIHSWAENEWYAVCTGHWSESSFSRLCLSSVWDARNTTSITQLTTIDRFHRNEWKPSWRTTTNSSGFFENTSF